MQRLLIVSVITLTSVLALGCGEQPDDPVASESAASPSNDDLDFFRHSESVELAHFRVEFKGKTVGEQEDAEGHATVVKEYLVGKSVTADFYVQPGAERLAIAQDTEGKVIALYLKNLGIVDEHAEADAYGLANNFGFLGPSSGRSGPVQHVSRSGTAQKPEPTRFLVGKRFDGRTGGIGMMAGGDGPMGPEPEYTVKTELFYTIELVGIKKLSEILAANHDLDNIVPPEVIAEAKRDMVAANEAASEPNAP